MSEQPQEKGPEQSAPMTILDTQTFTSSDKERPYIQVVAQTDNARVILFIFQTGQGMDDHRTSHPIIVQSLHGQITFRVAEQTVLLQPGMLLKLEGGVAHSVLAQTDAMMLLTML